MKKGNAERGAVAVSVLALLAAAAVDQALAKDLGDMARKASGALSVFPTVVEYLFYVIGALLVLAGFYKLKRNTDNPQQQSGMGVVMTIAAGVLMVVFPAAVDMLAGTLDLATGGTVARPKMQ